MRKRDSRLRRTIDKIGAFTLESNDSVDIFHSLIRSILYQQLHAKAASAIHSRLRGYFEGRDPNAQQLAEIDDAKLVAAGISRSKALALRDLARAALSGEVPSRAQAKRLSNEELIERLTKIRGVGQWTVEMLMIFNLGRADVLAVDDFALKAACATIYKLSAPPKRAEFNAIGDKWRPYRTIAAWYLWRSRDPK